MITALGWSGRTNVSAAVAATHSSEHRIRYLRRPPRSAKAPASGASSAMASALTMMPRDQRAVPRPGSSANAAVKYAE